MTFYDKLLEAEKLFRLDETLYLLKFLYSQHIFPVNSFVRENCDTVSEVSY